ncbi:TLR1-like protein [Mya arenaria]|uniref:TLR1-like protein n=1 Tax=Mya arenaria TaxID=6604 RepID=A0ABY7G3S7_MYAAR|nr:TLR1-like protein [Mya arenaria]
MNIPHLPREKDYHVFVCHVNENVHEVRTIVTNLEKGGVKCCYDERDFTAGRSILENMLEKINESVHMLFVLSEDFSKSRFAKHELEEAIHQQIREDFSIIPLKIEPCDVPQILKNKTYIDCENDDITKVHHKIIEAVIDNEEDINELESIVKESYFMKNIHIYDFFPHITCLLLVLYLMLSLAVMMFMVYTMLDTSRTDSASGGFAILLVSVISPVVATILSMGCCCWKKQTKNVNLMVKDLFIRKCEQREEFQKRRREGETLNDYADRMINWLLCSKDIYLLDKPRQLQRGHSMINGAPCICLLLRDSLL